VDGATNRAGREKGGHIGAAVFAALLPRGCVGPSVGRRLAPGALVDRDVAGGTLCLHEEGEERARQRHQGVQVERWRHHRSQPGPQSLAAGAVFEYLLLMLAASASRSQPWPWYSVCW
jgi:hypothetical protein